MKKILGLFNWLKWEILITFDPNENDLYTQMGKDYWLMRSL